MKKNITVGFKPTILALALMASFQAIAADPVVITDQKVTNTGSVTNSSLFPDVVSHSDISHSFFPINLSTGATVSVTATGAAASVSVSAINAPLPVSSLGANITQFASNTGDIVSNYYVSDSAPFSLFTQPLNINLAGPSAAAGGAIGIGASVSIAATGAVASVSVSGISADGTSNLVLPTIGDVSQFRVVGSTYSAGVSNSASVTNLGSITSIGNMFPGASAAISATGAVGSVGVSIVAADAMANPAYVLPITTAASIGQISQYISNTGVVLNTGVISMASPSSPTPAPLLDTASSVSISASGAVAAVNISLANSSLTAPVGGWTVGPVVQYVKNEAASITNNGTFTAATGPDLGPSASVSIAATGAAASFSVSAVSGNANASEVTLPTLIGGALTLPEGAPLLGTGITQYANNTVFVENTGSISSLGVLNPGASASITASGAIASVGISANNSNLVAFGLEPVNTVMAGIGQVASNGLNALITNTGSITTDILNAGAAVSVGATGAVASLNVSAINGGMAGLNINPAESVVSPAAYLLNKSDLSTLAIYQNAINLAPITNIGAVTTGNLEVGASASVSATGAATSVAFSSINSSANGSVVGPIAQLSSNSGNVSNLTNGNRAMSVGAIGNGASASISASGAVASLSVGLNTSTINTASGSTAFTFGDITQTVINSGAVDNHAAPSAPLFGVAAPAYMSVADIGGTGASASISASGAVASVSFSSILGTPTNIAASGEPVFAYRWNQSFGAINQEANNNYANVTNSGVINAGGITGISASASVGATGGATAFSVSSIADPVLTSPSGSALTAAIPTSIYQVASNIGAITNAGSIAFTGGGSAVTLGVGASVSVSATGAVSSVSYRSVNTGSPKT